MPPDAAIASNVIGRGPLDSDLYGPTVDAQHPWLGLLPYKEEHSEFFFGRDREVEDILGRIRDNSLTLLYGQSGLGKSSLLAAGVVPRLREQGYVPIILRLGYQTATTNYDALLSASLAARTTDGTNADHKGIAPEVSIYHSTPLDQTRAALSHCLPLSKSPSLPTTLWELFHHQDTPASPIPVLIFDQFEEIFTLGAQPQFEQEVADWIEQMADLLQNRPPRALTERFAQDPALAEQYHFGDAPVRIVFSLREDYLAHLERWKTRLPLLMQNRMALTLLTGPQARQAVLGPAQLGDHSLVTREVAESIVRTVARVPSDTPLDQIKAVPPLLSLLCEQLNAARLSVVHASGLSVPPDGRPGETGSPDIRSQITAEMAREQSADILQRFYEDSFTGFPPEHRARIRCLLEDPPMITEAGYRNALVRDDAEAQLARAGVPDAEAIFDTLIQRRLITAETRDQVQRLEITHDVLVPLLVRSRKERQDREAKEQAERAATAAKAEQDRLARERRRLRWIIAAMTALALIAAVFSAYGWTQARIARNAEIAARASEGKANEARTAALASAQAAEEARQTAEQTRQSALSAADKEKAANEKNLRTLHEASMADYAVAVQRIEKDGKWSEGVAHLARSLRWEPDNPLAAARLYSTLALYGAEKQSWPRQLLRHEGEVNSAQFSPDGTRIVTASGDKTARVWDAASGKPIGDPLRHEASVLSAEFSPDGTLIATASEDETARVWNVASGKPLGEPLRHEAMVVSTQFSPDGKRIVTASWDKSARVWDAASGKPLGGPLRHEAGVVNARFSSDGTRIVTASLDKTARVWDAASGKPIAEPLRHTSEVNSAQFSPDGTRIVTASGDKTARVWDAASGKPLGEPLRHEAMVISMQFNLGGTRIVTASYDSTARVWDAASGKPIGEPLRHEGGLTSAQFSPDGTRIVTASFDKTSRVWDAASGKPLGEPLRHEASVRSAQFNPDGTRIVTAGGNNTARVWDAASGKPIGEPLRHEEGVSSAQFSPDGTRIVTASWDKTARVWDAASGKPIGEPLHHEDSVSSAQFSPDGKRIVTASNDKTARVWNATSGKPVGEPLRHEASVRSAKFSPDGTRIVTADGDLSGSKGEARVWVAATGKPAGNPLVHDRNVESAEFSPDGTRIVTSNWDKSAQVWDAASGKPLGEPLPYHGGVRYAQFSPDGTRIVTASGDNTARVWDAASGKPLGEALRHEDSVSSAKFSPDGKHIVTASIDKTARVWDATSGKPVGEPLRHEDSVKSTQFNPDSTRIVTASWDKTARVWDAGHLIQPPVPAPEWMLRYAQVIAGLEFDDDGQMKTMPSDQRMALLTTPPPDDSPWSKLARWLALPANERTLTPDSKFTSRQIAERERDSGTKEGIESALRYDPTVPLAHLMLAKFEENPQRAPFLRDYELKRLPDDASLWSRASVSLLEQEQAQAALDAARKAITLDPHHIDGHRALAGALGASGHPADALEAWDKVLVDKEEATFLDFCNAGYLAAQNDLEDKARAIFAEGEKRFPSSPRIMRMKGLAMLLLHAPAEALAALKFYEPKAAAIGVKAQPSGVAALAVSRWLTGDKDGAVTDYQRLIGMVPGYADIDAVTKSNWEAPIEQPLLELLAETLKRHPELTPKPEKP